MVLLEGVVGPEGGPILEEETEDEEDGGGEDVVVVDRVKVLKVHRTHDPAHPEDKSRGGEAVEGHPGVPGEGEGQIIPPTDHGAHGLGR
jgi:hypothetical protein